MEYRKFGNIYAVRIDLGEDIVESLKKLGAAEQIRLGRVFITSYYITFSSICKGFADRKTVIETIFSSVFSVPCHRWVLTSDSSRERQNRCR